MQTVDTCMQYWRQKIMKIRGQSLSSRFFSLIILIPDCPPPSNAIAFWPIWTLPSSEGILSDCELLSSEFALVYLQRRRTLVMLCSSSIQVWKSIQVNTTQVCKYVQVHKCTKNGTCAQVNTQVCRGAVPLTGQAQLLLPCHRETIFLLDQQPLRVTITS